MPYPSIHYVSDKAFVNSLVEETEQGHPQFTNPHATQILNICPMCGKVKF